MTKTKIGRRTFLQAAGLSVAAIGAAPGHAQVDAVVPETSIGWEQISDRKIRLGIIGFGVCQYGADFEFQRHPNCEIVAVSDLIPERRDALAKAVRCGKTYDSLEELIQDDSIEAIFCATDAPQHARHAIEALKHGKHVAMSTPAIWGSLEEAEELYETVLSTGLKYMLFETSYDQEDCTAMRNLYRAGALGKIFYSEGEYFHWVPEPIDSYKGWRIGNPPQWYPSHATAYYVGVTGGSFTDVSCHGVPSSLPFLQPGANVYNNRFSTEVAFLRTSEGGASRMAISWDTPGMANGVVVGRLRGERGSFYGKYEGLVPDDQLPSLKRPPLPPTVQPGSDEGTHGYLTDEFLMSIIEDRNPTMDVATALNMTVPGVVAHASALKDGETMKVPQYAMPCGSARPT